MNQFFAYFRLKEMTPVKVFLAFVVIEAVAWFVRLPLWFAIAFTFFSVAFLVWLFMYSLTLAKTRFAFDIERNQNAAMIHALSEGIIAYDQNFKITSLNSAAEAICGVRAQEVVGQVVTPEWVSQEYYRVFAQIIFPSLAPTVVKKTTTASYPQIVEVSFSEPRELHVEVTTTQIFDENKKLLGFMKIIRDRSREIQLLQSKSEFITIAAHQLRTPLSGIKWGIEALYKGDVGPLTEEQSKVAEQTYHMVERLASTVENLLDVSKLEEGKFGYRMAKGDIVELAQSVMETYTQSAQQHEVKLLFFPPDQHIPQLTFDASKITLVLQNLIDNAIKYNVQNGEVRARIELMPDKPYVKISIEDTGIGVPQDDMKLLFTKFYRSEETLKKEAAGSGLGLYISKNIVKRHGGDIWATSTQGRGSVFSFALPTDESLIPPTEVGANQGF